MSPRRYFLLTLLLSIGGTLFAAYQSGYKFFVRSCAFGEACPYVWGLPACYYGLALFLILLGASAVGLRYHAAGFGPISRRIMLGASFAGLIFAGTLSVQELNGILHDTGAVYGLGLPTCVYGAIFFAAIFVLSVTAPRDAARGSSPAGSPRR